MPATQKDSAQVGAILVVRLTPQAHMEAEFNDWYDTEHVPERLAVPGFVGARRFFGGERFRYATLYDLAGPEVLTSDGYRVFFDGRRRTPWTARVGRHLARVDRRAYQLIGDPASGAIAQQHAHLALRSVEITPADASEHARRVAEHVGRYGEPGALHARVFIGVPQTEGFATKLTERPIAAERDLLVCYTAADYAALAHATSDRLGGELEVHRAYLRASA